MTFSGALVSPSCLIYHLPKAPTDFLPPFQTLTDLNDYITPSQACIKPLEQSNAPNPRTPGDAAVCADVSQDAY